MIEEICSNIIKELGSTGLLIIGLYFILEKGSRRISTHLQNINEELFEIITLLKSSVKIWQDQANGKDRGNAGHTG